LKGKKKKDNLKGPQRAADNHRSKGLDLKSSGSQKGLGQVTRVGKPLTPRLSRGPATGKGRRVQGAAKKTKLSGHDGWFRKGGDIAKNLKCFGRKKKKVKKKKASKVEKRETRDKVKEYPFPWAVGGRKKVRKVGGEPGMVQRRREPREKEA